MCDGGTWARMLCVLLNIAAVKSRTLPCVLNVQMCCNAVRDIPNIRDIHDVVRVIFV